MIRMPRPIGIEAVLGKLASEHAALDAFLYELGGELVTDLEASERATTNRNSEPLN